jgi:hypothetical protein
MGGRSPEHSLVPNYFNEVDPAVPTLQYALISSVTGLIVELVIEITTVSPHGRSSAPVMSIAELTKPLKAFAAPPLSCRRFPFNPAPPSPPSNLLRLHQFSTLGIDETDEAHISAIEVAAFTGANQDASLH